MASLELPTVKVPGVADNGSSLPYGQYMAAAGQARALSVLVPTGQSARHWTRTVSYLRAKAALHTLSEQHEQKPLGQLSEQSASVEPPEPTVPAAHSWHVPAPASLHVPGLHASQNVAPASLANRPAAHVPQLRFRGVPISMSLR